MTINGDHRRQTENGGGNDAQIRSTAREQADAIGALAIKNISLRNANEFVAQHHRHHKPVTGHKFSLALFRDDQLCGVVICGRPVARLANQNMIEVTRLCTDGTPNACSKLYGAAARAAKALGYEGIQTYILENELGTSLKASNWKLSHTTNGGQWRHTDQKPRRTDQPTGKKQCWHLIW